MLHFPKLLFIFLAYVVACSVLHGQESKPTPALDIATISLPRIEPLTVQQAEAAFDIAVGYRIELVASEPLVVDPVAFCFDAQGRMLVIEMRDYSERPDDRLGRLRRLTDDDADGRMDRAETIVENLSWPTAVECWNGGIVIAAAPDLLFLANDFELGETPQLLATGFGRSNVQGLVNSLRWGLDLRLHGATSSSESVITSTEQVDALRLGRRDFAILNLKEPFRIEPTNGGGQHGMSIDPWGDKYVCSNSDHLQQVMLTSPHAQRSSLVSSSPHLRRSIAADGPQADVFRLSPVEPWRVWRTQLRVSGQVPGLVEGGGRAAGYFTGATGVFAYDGDQWSQAEHPIALVCDVGSNLIHRKRLVADGLWSRGERIDEADEFLRSSDIWFRPVQLGTGPDGALYVADMYREVIEHPLSLPPAIKSQLDLNSGNDRGRIWRIVSTQQTLRRQSFDLNSCSAMELVKLLDHANGWQRRTAARLLAERQDTTTIEPIRQMTKSANHAEGRVQSLAALVTIPGGLDRKTLDNALLDSHPRVRQRALEIASSTPSVFPELRPAQCQTLSVDDWIFVRFQLAYDAATLINDHPLRAQSLAKVAQQNPNDPWIRWAVEGSLGDSTSLFADWLTESMNGWNAQDKASWQQSVACQLTLSNTPQSTMALTRLFDNASDPAAMGAAAKMLPSISPKDRQPLVDWIKARNLSGMTNTELSELAKRNKLGAELLIFKWASPDQASQLLETLLHPEYAPAVQQTALTHLTSNDPATSAMVIDRLDQLTPTVRQAAFEALSATRAGLRLIVERIKSGTIAPSQLPETLRRQLSEHPDSSLRIATSDAPALSSTGVADQILKTYSVAMNEQGDVNAGHAVYARICASCHRIGEEGKAIGPDLRSVVDKSPDQILVAILDPNREVDPKYNVVNVETTSGRIVAGILVNESDTELELIDSQGTAHSIRRDEVEMLRIQSRSLMPEGIYKEVTPDQMRDLVSFLKSQTTIGSASTSK